MDSNTVLAGAVGVIIGLLIIFFGCNVSVMETPTTIPKPFVYTPITSPIRKPAPITGHLETQRKFTCVTKPPKCVTLEWDIYVPNK